MQIRSNAAIGCGSGGYSIWLGPLGSTDLGHLLPRFLFPLEVGAEVFGKLAETNQFPSHLSFALSCAFSLHRRCFLE